jgi:hypothetical protein
LQSTKLFQPSNSSDSSSSCPQTFPSISKIGSTMTLFSHRNIASIFFKTYFGSYLISDRRRAFLSMVRLMVSVSDAL